MNKDIIDSREDDNPDFHFGKDAETIGLALALRDFFLAKKGDEMLAALRSLGLNVSPESEAELEYEFNRLFVGPTPPKAPPWASVYLESEPRLMGESTLFVRRLCANLGLAAPDGFPEDWLPFELELWMTARALAEESPADGKRLAEELVRRARSWIPAFAKRTREASDDEAINFAAARLLEWLSKAKE